jgi:hypothetical protein
MSTKVDPFIQPIPSRFANDRELRSYYEYLHKHLHDLWVRTGGSEDVIANADVQEKFPWELAAKPEETVIGVIDFPVQVQADSYRAVTVTTNYTSLDFDYINAKSRATITLPEYPKDNSVVIIRNGDGSEIGLNGNGRLINGFSTGKLRRQGTALTLQYFIDDNEWFAR